MSEARQILFPVGRLVMGSLYDGQTKDANNQPLIVKTGPNTGQPMVKYFFAVAIPKMAGHTHWSQTDWGAVIWQAGYEAFPQGQGQSPTFAWKVEDGDSTTPNKRGRVPAQTEGFAGHWIVSFSSTFAPKLYTADGSAELTEPGTIKLGHFVEVFGSVVGNNNAQNPGVYINHSMVAYSGYGPEISRGPDPGAVGFGQGPLPPGASEVPPPALPGATPPSAAPAAVSPPPIPNAAAPATPPASAPPVPSTPAATAAPATPPATPTPVQPHDGFMTPPVPSAPAAPAAPVWNGPAGTSREQYAAAGWTDEQMRAQGLIA